MTFFRFEADFVESLRCIPMLVRLKLDTCGIKLKLSHWLSFNQIERQKLIDLPCASPAEISDYQNFLLDLISKNSQSTNLDDLRIFVEPIWENSVHIPSEVELKAETLRLKISVEQWVNLGNLQRFALIKLSRSHHENHNFLPALQEFGLLP